MKQFSNSNSSDATLRYVIITPAYNEERYIGQTIDRVIHQTLQPLCLLIVDDGSTDNTAKIVDQAATNYPLISCHFREKKEGEAYFASNVRAIMEGYNFWGSEDFEFLAILDADVVLPHDYYQIILGHFDNDLSLVVASGIYDNLVNGKLQKKLNDRRSTPKAIQVFRKEVFDTIGGFLPLKYGGEDTISCVMARMHGWKVWSFPEIKATHLRPTGTGATTSLLSARYQNGICEYHVGSHPLFFLLKSFRLMLLERPFLIGGTARMARYLCAACCHKSQELPEGVKDAVRREQLERVLKGNKIC